MVSFVGSEFSFGIYRFERWGFWKVEFSFLVFIVLKFWEVLSFLVIGF